MRVNERLTINAGTPVQLAPVSTWVRSLFIQMRHGGTGYGTVLDMSQPGLHGVTPSAATGAHVTAELAPATASAPGGSYTYADTDRGFDLQWIYVDGSVTSDTVTVSYDQKV